MQRTNLLVTFLVASVAALLAGCGSDSKGSQTTAPVTSSTEPTEPTEPAEATPVEATPAQPTQPAPPPAPTYLHGKWVWFELRTTNTEKSKAFFAELLGWQIESQEMMGMKYELAKAGGKDVATLSATEGKAKSHWVPFVSVPDVDAAVKTVEEQKGKVVKPAQDVPEIGRFATVTDPNGAEFALFKGTKSDDPDGPPMAGHFVWNEYLTRNKKQHETALAFYPAVVGYTTSQMEMPSDKSKKKSMYDMLNFNEVARAGVQTAKPTNLGGQWLPWVTVDDVAAAVANVKKLKGRVLLKPVEVPTVGLTAIVADPTGAAIGLVKPASPDQQKPAAPAAPAPAPGAETGGQKK